MGLSGSIPYSPDSTQAACAGLPAALRSGCLSEGRGPAAATTHKRQRSMVHQGNPPSAPRSGPGEPDQPSPAQPPGPLAWQ